MGRGGRALPQEEAGTHGEPRREGQRAEGGERRPRLRREAVEGERVSVEAGGHGTRAERLPDQHGGRGVGHGGILSEWIGRRRAPTLARLWLHRFGTLHRAGEEEEEEEEERER